LLQTELFQFHLQFLLQKRAHPCLQWCHQVHHAKLFSLEIVCLSFESHLTSFVDVIIVWTSFNVQRRWNVDCWWKIFPPLRAELINFLNSLPFCLLKSQRKPLIYIMVNVIIQITWSKVIHFPRPIGIITVNLAKASLVSVINRFIVAIVRAPSCIKGLNLAGMAPKESFCQATSPCDIVPKCWHY